MEISAADGLAGFARKAGASGSKPRLFRIAENDGHYAIGSQVANLPHIASATH
jgi:hypothetical protein